MYFCMALHKIKHNLCMCNESIWLSNSLYNFTTYKHKNKCIAIYKNNYYSNTLGFKTFILLVNIVTS